MIKYDDDYGKWYDIDHNCKYYEATYSNGKILYRSYYLNGLSHRLDGPAYIYYDTLGSIICEGYYLLGRHITEEEFNTPGFVDAFILENS
jgi:hypothetical protein